MTYYQQTLIIPMPKQRLCEPQRSVGYGDRRRSVARNQPNRELNSILAFFD